MFRTKVILKKTGGGAFLPPPPPAFIGLKLWKHCTIRNIIKGNSTITPMKKITKINCSKIRNIIYTSNPSICNIDSNFTYRSIPSSAHVGFLTLCI